MIPINWNDTNYEVLPSVEFTQSMKSLCYGSRYFPVLDRCSYFLHAAHFNFFLYELHGIWDEKATVEQRLSRASYMSHMLPETEGYALDIGLVPWNKEFPGADIPYLSALN